MCIPFPGSIQIFSNVAITSILRFNIFSSVINEVCINSLMELSFSLMTRDCINSLLELSSSLMIGDCINSLFEFSSLLMTRDCINSLFELYLY
jgi:hypothetical protein